LNILYDIFDVIFPCL